MPDPMTPEVFLFSTLVNLFSQGIVELAYAQKEAVTRGNEIRARELEKEIQKLQSRRSAFENVSGSIVERIKVLPVGKINEALKNPANIDNLSQCVTEGKFSIQSLTKLTNQIDGIEESDIEAFYSFLIGALSNDPKATNAALLINTNEIVDKVNSVGSRLERVEQTLNQSILPLSDRDELDRLRELSTELQVQQFEKAEQLMQKEAYSEAIDVLIQCLERTGETNKKEEVEFKTRLHLKLAAASLLCDRPTEYKRYFELALERGATYKQIRTLEAFHFYHTGEKGQAAEIYSDLHARFKESSLFENLCIVYIEQRKFNELSELLDSISEKGQNASYWAMRSVLNDERGEFEEALQAAEKAVALDSDHRSKLNFAYRVCGYVENLKVTGNFIPIELREKIDQAFQFFNEYFNYIKSVKVSSYTKQSLGNIIAYGCLLNRRKNVYHIAEYLSNFVTDEDCLRNLLQFYMQEDQEEEALKIVQAYRRAYKSDLAEFFEYNLRSLLQEHEEVLKYYFKNEERLKKCHQWYSLVANSYIGNFDRNGALTYLEQLKELDPRVTADIGFIYSSEQNYEEAHIHYTEYLVKYPDDHQVRVMLAQNESFRCNWFEALKHYKLAGQQHFNSPFILDVVKCAYNSKEYQLCIGLIDETILLGKPTASIYEIKAAIQYDNFFIRDCLATIQELRSLTKSNRSLVELQAMCLMRIDNYDTAEAVIRTALATSSETNLEVFYLKCLILAGKVKEAIERCISILNITPDNLQIREKLFGISVLNLDENTELSAETEAFIKENSKIVFEHSDAIIPISIPSKSDGTPNTAKFLKEIRKTKVRQEQCRKNCERQGLPFSVFAREVGASQFQTYASLKLNICSGLGGVNDSKACENAIKNGIVLHTSSLVTIFQLELFEPLRKSTMTTFVHQSSLDEILELSKILITEKQTSVIEPREKGKFSMTNFTQGDKLQASLELAPLIEYILSDKVTLVGSGIEPLDCKNKAYQEFDSTEKEHPNIFTGIRSAIEKGATFVCDDPNLRILAKSLNVKVIGSTNLFRSFSEKIIPITPLQSYEYAKKLMKLGYPHIGLSSRELCIMLENDDEELLTQFSRDIHNEGYSLNSSTRVLAETFSHLINKKTDQSDKLLWILKVCLDHDKDRVQAIQFLLSHIGVMSMSNIDTFKKTLNFVAGNLEGYNQFEFLYLARFVASHLAKVLSTSSPVLAELWTSLLNAEKMLACFYYD